MLMKTEPESGERLAQLTLTQHLRHKSSSSHESGSCTVNSMIRTVHSELGCLDGERLAQPTLAQHLQPTAAAAAAAIRQSQQ
jgi:hypothetical protein